MCCTSFAIVLAQYAPQYQVKKVPFNPIVFTPIEYKPEPINYPQRSYDKPSRQNAMELGESWQVVNIYEKKKAPSNSKMLDSYGEPKNVEYLLVPCDIDGESYVITIKNVSNYIYEVVDQEYYIELENSVYTQMFSPCSIIKPTAKVLLKKEYSTWIVYEIK